MFERESSRARPPGADAMIEGGVDARSDEAPLSSSGDVRSSCPTRRETLAWGDATDIADDATPRTELSPTRGGTLRWGDFSPIAEEGASRSVSPARDQPSTQAPNRPRPQLADEPLPTDIHIEPPPRCAKPMSPVRGGSLRWDEFLKAGVDPSTLTRARSEPASASTMRSALDAALDDLSVENLLTPLLSLVPRGRAVDRRRDAAREEPSSNIGSLPGNLASAIRDALGDESIDEADRIDASRAGSNALA